MDEFHYREDQAYCEEVPLAELAETYGTPLYVYSKGTLNRHCLRFREAFKSHPTLACYAVKANSNLQILRTIFATGFGADIVSGGELERALLAGARPEQIIYSGVGKQTFEMERALDVGIYAFNVESMQEVQALQQVARAKKKIARISLRLNPNIEVTTHPHIATGLYATKFGIAENELPTLLSDLKEMKEISLVGVACHIGSQILDLSPFQQAARRLVGHARELKSQGFPIEFVDAGGGFGIRYHQESPPEFETYAQSLLAQVKDSPFRLLIEPGRVVVGNAGILLTKTLYEKTTPMKRFAIIDAAMNDLIRPSLYEAHHEIEVVNRKAIAGKPSFDTDVVGPVCETGDFLGQGRRLPVLGSGALLMLRSAGAYGMSMASNYNTRGRAAEVLVDKKSHALIRRRETLQDLLSTEVAR